jgi:Ca-activated chloride channel family protein
VSGLSFGSPAFLALIGLVLPLAWWGIRNAHRQQQAALAEFGDESLLAQSSGLPAASQYQTRLGLQTAVIVLGLLALARPQLGERPTQLAHTGRDLLVLLDLSRSMNAVDEELTRSRLAVAKATIAQVLAAAPENRVGLIVFGGSAFLQLPLTGNHDAFQRFLDAASTDDLGDPATNLSNALAAAATTFEHEGERGYQSILLVSDGESGEGDVGPALSRLRRAGVSVLAIGVGNPAGSPVPADSTELPEKWHRDHIGRVVLSRLEEADLRRTASETNGAYARWSPGAGHRLGNELARMQKRTLSSRESTERVDRFQWPLALAVIVSGLTLSAGKFLRKSGS